MIHMVETKFKLGKMPAKYGPDEGKDEHGVPILGDPIGEPVEVILCPEYPECPVYIHEDTKAHREVIKRHIKKKHSNKKD